MWFLQWHEILVRIVHPQSHLPALILTVGAALLIGCATSCACGPADDKDDIFHNHVC